VSVIPISDANKMDSASVKYILVLQIVILTGKTITSIVEAVVSIAGKMVPTAGCTFFVSK
jgi:hypothetical protein